MVEALKKNHKKTLNVKLQVIPHIRPLSFINTNYTIEKENPLAVSLGQV